MREIVIQFPGDNWDNEAEAERIEARVQLALDDFEIDYLDLHIK